MRDFHGFIFWVAVRAKKLAANGNWAFAICREVFVGSQEPDLLDVIAMDRSQEQEKKPRSHSLAVSGGRTQRNGILCAPDVNRPRDAVKRKQAA
jgi:hypothetical protein